METNEEQGVGSTATSRPKKQRHMRKFRGLTCANCRIKKVVPTILTKPIFHDYYHYYSYRFLLTLLLIPGPM